MAQTPKSPVLSQRTAYLLGEWWNAAFGSYSYTIAAGITTAIFHRIFRNNAKTLISPGRTVYSQGSLQDDYGRDHHGRCYSMWMAGGGFQPGALVGQTDDYGYNIVEDPIHIHDFQATLLHCLGFDHERLTYRYQGRDFRLTDVHGQVVQKLLAT
jgi:hypothetical protein